jgi:hypothetical protein
MADKNSHPEQDPAEGSREVIDRDLARQDKKQSEADHDLKKKSEGTSR